MKIICFASFCCCPIHGAYALMKWTLIDDVLEICNCIDRFKPNETSNAREIPTSNTTFQWFSSVSGKSMTIFFLYAWIPIAVLWYCVCMHLHWFIGWHMHTNNVYNLMSCPSIDNIPVKWNKMGIFVIMSPTWWAKHDSYWK